MAKGLYIQENGSVLIDGAELDVRNWTCNPPQPNPGGANITALEAFKKINEGKNLQHLVIGIIGPREATAAQMTAAEKIGNILGKLGLTLICGGKSGVMEAASLGCHDAGGMMIGILPGSDATDANPYLSIPLPTGLSEARNMVIAKSARVLIAVGGSYGTLSDVAYGLHFSKPVIGVEDAPVVDGVTHAADVNNAVELALQALLQSAADNIVSEEARS